MVPREVSLRYVYRSTAVGLIEGVVSHELVTRKSNVIITRINDCKEAKVNGNISCLMK